MTFEPTIEQAAIVAAAKSTKTNLLLSALAGAAKTSTLELICRAITDIPILSIAFNKRISDEMKDRLPSHVTCKTVNALGHQVWSQAIGRRLIVDTKKSFDLLKAIVDEMPRSERGDARDSFGDLLRAISSAKSQGYIPEGKFLDTPRLISARDYADSFDEEPEAWFLAIVDEVLTRSIKMAYDGKIDFDDQVYCSTLFGGTFPSYPLVLIDEAQDLSPLNHAMLKKLVKTRLIAVGDHWQSIYGFRGASSDSMAKLKETFSMTEMPLSISFRCPRSIVEVARFRAPSMMYPDWAKEGEVATLHEWHARDIPDGSAIICRNNAPLFKCALALIRLGRGIKLVGTDLGPQLVKALKKLGPETMTQTQVYEAIARWESERMKKSRAKASTQDRADCLRVFASFGPTLSVAVAYAETLFASSGPILLMSGHKSKGLEFDTVYFLNQDLIPSIWSESEEDLAQEDNLRYVVVTRSKDRLFYVDLQTLGE